MQVGRLEARRPADLLCPAQRTSPTLSELLCPAADRLSVDAELPRDLGLAHALAQQIHRLHPALLERIEISSYSSWVSHVVSIR
jgi:hypothetical protein